MFNIRVADESDVEAILSYGEEFFRESPFSDSMDYCRESVARLIDCMLDGGFWLVAHKDEKFAGMIGMIIRPHILNNSHMVATEVAFWVSPEFRGSTLGYRLVCEAEALCGELGADAVAMCTLSSSPPVVEKLYTRLGFHKRESYYTKEVT